ncbi:SpoIIAA family protein [Hymenobacter yonginensis]|uniref:STAS/SEC14 domain-containing protein n=1 Tax=Hymenobacter yonginensis TaxID=748197 RepID=A0ABY7PMX5_9BACT|nr:STAS/SEC14 domain-containing protein [Hymenobacter yonginensis]WBO83977.1 STAS/SEC14 domain-containing protein [Hymenobacter yonginensis]
MVYFENPAGQVLEDPTQLVRIVWRAGIRKMNETQALLTHARLALQRYGWHRVLINQTQMVPFTPEEQQWIGAEWLPLATAAGYRHGAIVVSPDVMVRLATAFITTQVQSRPLVYRSFEDEAEALAWLQKQ